MEEPVQELAAQLLGKEASLWVFENQQIQAEWRGVVRAGYAALNASPPNLAAAQRIVERLESAIGARVTGAREDRRWQRVGMATLAATVLALLAAGWAIPKSLTIVGIPLWVPVLGALGGAASGLVALRQPIDIHANRQSVVFAAVSRPIVGILTGSVAFALVASGIVSVTVAGDPLLFRALAVLVGGYSERLLGQAVTQVEQLLSRRPSEEEAAKT